MKKLVRIAVAGAAVVVVLAVIFFVVLGKPAQRDGGSIVFTDGEPIDVQSVVVANETGEYTFRYDAQLGGYAIDDIPADLIDMTAFIAFLSNCAQLSATQQIETGDNGLSAYGLDAPAATANIVFFDGAVVKLAVGDVERISQNYYVTVSGHEGVYLMPRGMAQPFLLSKKQVISPYVTPTLGDITSPLSAVRDVTFTGGGLEEPVTILTTSGAADDVKLDALSFGAPTHIVRGAGVFEMDQTYGTEILGSLVGLQAVDILAYNLSEEDFSALGFDSPYMTVEYDMIRDTSGTKQHCLLKLVQLDETTFLATLDGSGAVYVVGRAAFVDIDYARLPARWFLKPLIMDLSSVTVETPSGRYRFDIDNTDTANPVVTYNGQVLDTGLFRAFFRLVTSAEHDGTYLGEQPQPGGAPVMTITYRYSDPAKEPDVMALYTGDARRVNVFINGVGEFAMKDSFVTRMAEGCQNLIEGNPIDESWQ